jgi:peptidoglycan/xylan/chitin deacetylase (PgdA/CDA1 family)
MHEKDEAVAAQRRRRKRVARIRNSLIFMIFGWIVVSLVLIVILIMRMAALENKLNNIVVTSTSTLVPEAVAEEAGTSSQDVTSTVSQYGGISTVSVDVDEDNIASADDVHQVYLTFDCEPSENTEDILDILRKYGVKATFFVSASDYEGAEAVLKRISDEGHTIGMHSYSNRYSVIYQSLDSFEQDYEQIYSYIYDATGVECKYYRFLGGSGNQISNVPMGTLIDYVDGQGAVYFDWNVSAGDEAPGAYTSDEIVQNIIEDVDRYKESVVLLHDSEELSQTAAALSPLIQALEDMDAVIAPIDEDTKPIQYVQVYESAEDED